MVSFLFPKISYCTPYIAQQKGRHFRWKPLRQWNTMAVWNSRAKQEYSSAHIGIGGWGIRDELTFITFALSRTTRKSTSLTGSFIANTWFPETQLQLVTSLLNPWCFTPRSIWPPLHRKQKYSNPSWPHSTYPTVRGILRLSRSLNLSLLC